MAQKQPLKLIVPSSRSELEKFVARIGGLQSDIALKNADYKKRIAEIEVEGKTEVNALEAKLKELVDGVAAYAQAHRQELIGDGTVTKTVQLATGTITWRFTPWKVVLHRVEDIIEYAKKRKLLKKFLRIKTEFDKEAALGDRKNAEKIPGVSFEQSEVLTIKPNDTEGELEVSESQLKRLVA